MQELEKEGRDREGKGWEIPREGERVTVFFFLFSLVLLLLFQLQALFISID
jgi:hypothetical protein